MDAGMHACMARHSALGFLPNDVAPRESAAAAALALALMRRNRPRWSASGPSRPCLSKIAAQKFTASWGESISQRPTRGREASGNAAYLAGGLEARDGGRAVRQEDEVGEALARPRAGQVAHRVVDAVRERLSADHDLVRELERVHERLVKAAADASAPPTRRRSDKGGTHLVAGSYASSNSALSAE